MNTDQLPANGYNPACLELDARMLREVHPEWFGFSGALMRVARSVTRGTSPPAILRRHLRIGDARAAVVVSCKPHLLAAYTDELDAVAVLRVPDVCRDLVPSDIGARAISVNTYWEDGDPLPDIRLGPRSTGLWVSFHPVIASFISQDLDRIDELRSRIAPWEWDRAALLGSQWLIEFGEARARDGRPGWSGVPIERVRK